MWNENLLDKPCVYCLVWLNEYDWTWAKEGELSKLLGIPFGLNLDTINIDCLYSRKFQRNLKLTLVGRIVIVNHVLCPNCGCFVYHG